jgi:hypothetical protein
VYSALHYVFQAIALFNANRIKEALLRVDRLSADSSADPLACGIVVVSLAFTITLMFVRRLIGVRFVHQASLRFKPRNYCLEWRASQ